MRQCAICSFSTHQAVSFPFEIYVSTITYVGTGTEAGPDSNEHASCRVNYASCVNIVCHLLAAKFPFPNFHASLSFRLAKRLSLAPTPAPFP